MGRITVITGKSQKSALYREADNLRAIFEELEEVGRMTGRPNLATKVYLSIMDVLHAAKPRGRKE